MDVNLVPLDVGFTGSQNGMTTSQRAIVSYILNKGPMSSFHHGDCIGADAEVHELVLGLESVPIIIHPPDNPTKRAFCQGATEVKPEKPYLERNRDIVDACEILVATPSGPERLRSGTWSTVRYARKARKDIIIVWPDGSVKPEVF